MKGKEAWLSITYSQQSRSSLTPLCHLCTCSSGWVPCSVVKGNVAVIQTLLRGDIVADNLLHQYSHNEGSRELGSKIATEHLCVSRALGTQRWPLAKI